MGTHPLTTATRVPAWVLAATVLFAHGDVHALTFLVGSASDGACDYATLQAAINAAAGNPGPDEIHVAFNASYLQQALTIGSQDLVVEGGYATCASAAPSGITIVNGAGGAAAPVLRISGSGVRDLRNLTIRGGDSTGSNYGGGIQFSGSGDLILRNVGVSNNSSTYGGGIYFNGSGGPAILTLETNTVVLNNTAQNSGGGIYIGGSARLFMLRDRTMVQGNSAIGGDGGGVYVAGPAMADIASPGYLNAGALDSNTALRGGGLAVVSTSNGRAGARLFGVDASRPVRLHGNRATDQGGAIWMQSWAGGFADSNEVAVCSYDILIDGNRAADGAAMYADYTSDIFGVNWYATFGLNGSECNVQAPETMQSLGRVACATGVNGCNFVSSNATVTSTGAETDGAILKLADGGGMQMQNTVMTANTGGNAIRGKDYPIVISSSMIVNNALSSDVVRVGNEYLKLEDNTIAANVNGGATHLIRFDGAGTLEMENNVIWQPGKLTLLYPGGGQNLSVDDIRYNVVSDTSTLPPGPYNLQADPRFIDPEASNFGLRISSPALDFSLPVVGNDLGIDGRPRDQQVRPGPPRTLVRDAGALERQPTDPYLINGTYDGSLRQWTNHFPEYTRWNAQDDGSGAGSGSVEMSIPGNETGTPGGIQVASLYGVTQCFAVPWPGTYTLGARGLSRINALVTFPDTPTVNWRLRYNSPGCTGAADVEGNLLVPSNIGWNSPLAPSTITIAASSWNFQTTLEISPGVLQNFSDPAQQNPIFALLDNIVLKYESDVIFRDGFESGN
ncbi:MAG: right-handed parallel beta-helix repeat-containing protein [Xanthomonadales bacterium]|nr:right-handed parallel beta-helix repeat-containing protein [Xanthomonadales bacterium]